MATLNDVLKVKALPAMPASMARLVPLLLDPDSDWAAMERVIRQDEGLAADVLRLAHSARFGAGNARFDLRAAMIRIGRDALRRHVLSRQIAAMAPAENAAFDLRRGALWRSALGGAIAAEHLALRHVHPADAGTAYFAALLRDIGKLALDLAFGADYLSLVAAHAAPDRTFVDAERRALGFDHAAVGAELARRWRLPDRVADAIRHHHAPPPPGPAHDHLFDLVHAADVICLWAGLGVGADGLDYTLAEHVRTGLDLDRMSVEREITLVWERVGDAESLLAEQRPQGVAA